MGTGEKSKLRFGAYFVCALNIQLDYFTEHRTNILMDRASIPADMGLAAKVRANVGEAKANGVDLSVDYNKFFAMGIGCRHTVTLPMRTANF